MTFVTAAVDSTRSSRIVGTLMASQSVLKQLQYKSCLPATVHLSTIQLNNTSHTVSCVIRLLMNESYE